jgi:hypothetical protein
MKRLLIVLMVVFLLASCTLDIRDADGFRLFAYGRFIHSENACAQSHDGFEVDGVFWNEYTHTMPYTITNIEAEPINVKITTFPLGSRWVVVTDSLIIGE